MGAATAAPAVTTTVVRQLCTLSAVSGHACVVLHFCLVFACDGAVSQPSLRIGIATPSFPSKRGDFSARQGAFGASAFRAAVLAQISIAAKNWPPSVNGMFGRLSCLCCCCE